LEISVDLDGITADLHKEWLRLYNVEHGASCTLHDLKHYDMHKNVEIGHKIYDYLATPGLYLKLDPLPGAVEALKRLQARGHDVHIITADSKNPQTAADKITWCRQHLGFLNRKQVTISHQKHRFLSDVFIDDAPPNLEEHAQRQPNVYRMGITWPYNECVKQFMHVRAPSYENTLGAWSLILDAIEKVAHGANL
jgi:5'(3')-deoxyribonucleotidase